MTFTTQPPTSPGFYAWRQSESHRITCAEVYVAEHNTFVPFVQMAGMITVGPVSSYGGEWCRLVPEQELAEAIAAKETVEAACERKDMMIEKLKTELRLALDKSVMEGKE